ncbi:hypothetical protein COCNU_03G013440 [Cocos nucifera]|uniref:Uncharacterized protein n=1 Tax=Cocos nucifera TaxID=13894 RepID=A0A8K0I4P6_COCNU|nr:hypothetical protein COCNU_03G013440 [Cocos nucifera]
MKAFLPSLGKLCNHHHQSVRRTISQSAAGDSDPLSGGDGCHPPSAVCGASETDSTEPRAARQHAAAVVTIKLHYIKDPPDTLRLGSLDS